MIVLRIYTLLCLMMSVALAVDYLKLESGKAITVVKSEVAAQQLDEGKAQIEVYDTTTGIMIGVHDEAIDREVDRTSHLELQTALYNIKGQEVAMVVGVERKKDNRVLPFGYVRVTCLADIQSGALLCNAEGQAIAFYYVDNSSQEYEGYVVPVSAAIRAHDDFQKNSSISRCWVGVIVSSEGTVPEVVSVRPDSPAAKAGLLKGDILYSVGARQTKTYLETVDAFYYLIPQEVETFTVLRKGETLSFQVTPVSRDSLF